MPARAVLLVVCLSVSFTAHARCHKCEHRSSAARREFKRLHPCPATGRSTGRCPGWTIDHVNPLDCGGLDAPENMHWQTRKAARAKDKWERIGCENGHRD